MIYDQSKLAWTSLNVDQFINYTQEKPKIFRKYLKVEWIAVDKNIQKTWAMKLQVLFRQNMPRQNIPQSIRNRTQSSAA